MLKKANPSPKNAILDYEGFTLEFKCYLQSNAFSYRCENYRSLGCSYLLTVLIKENYHPETWSFRSSTSDHSELQQEEESEGFDTVYETEIEPLILKVESEIEIEDQKGTN